MRIYQKKEFKKNYLKPEKPVILRGLWKDYPAYNKWTPDFFKSILGNFEIGVFDGQKETPDRSFKSPHYKMPFGEYIDHITSDSEEDLRLFLFNILKVKPELREDFSFPPLTNLYLRNIPFMFFGSKGAKVRMHQDMDWSNVFLTQLHGRKEVYLFAPEYSKLLYRYPFNVHSPINPEYPDLKNYPAFKYVKGYHCVLEPGDTLFMPSGYWHYIKNLEGGYAINQRALSLNPVNWLRGFINVAFRTHVDELMRSILGDDWFNYKQKRGCAKATEELHRLGLG